MEMPLFGGAYFHHGRRYFKKFFKKSFFLEATDDFCRWRPKCVASLVKYVERALGYNNLQIFKKNLDNQEGGCENGLVAKINAVSEIIEIKSSISPSQQTNMAKWNESLGRIQAEIQIITKELK